MYLYFLGTLAPSLRPSKLNDTIDLIFSTHWIYPSQIPVLQADDEKCVNDELSKRSGILYTRVEILPKSHLKLRFFFLCLLVHPRAGGGP